MALEERSQRPAKEVPRLFRGLEVRYVPARLGLNSQGKAATDGSIAVMKTWFLGRPPIHVPGGGPVSVEARDT
jgi:hypothetical protein